MREVTLYTANKTQVNALGRVDYAEYTTTGSLVRVSVPVVKLKSGALVAVSPDLIEIATEVAEILGRHD